MTVVMMIMVVMMVVIIMVVSMIVIMVTMMMMIVTSFLVHFIGLPRVLKTWTFIVPMMMVVVIMVIVFIMAGTKRRERQPQHHQEQTQSDVHPVGGRFSLAFYHDGGGLSPPTLSVIHCFRGTNAIRKGKSGWKSPSAETIYF